MPSRQIPNNYHISSHIGFLFYENRSLHKKGSFPTAVFDCIFVALGRNYEKIPNDLRERIGKLRQDEEFVIVTTKATMDAGKIHKRIELAEKYIFDMHV